jgi:hypothetical protein
MKTSVCRIKYNTILHAKETVQFAFNSRSFGLLIGEGVVLLMMMERSHSGFRDSPFITRLQYSPGGGGERGDMGNSRDNYLLYTSQGGSCSRVIRNTKVDSSSPKLQGLGLTMQLEIP